MKFKSDKQRKAVMANITQHPSQNDVVKVQRERMPRSMNADARVTAQNTFKLTDADGRDKWIKAPNRFDIEGLDDKRPSTQKLRKIELEAGELEDIRLKEEFEREHELSDEELHKLESMYYDAQQKIITPMVDDAEAIEYNIGDIIYSDEYKGTGEVIKSTDGTLTVKDVVGKIHTVESKDVKVIRRVDKEAQEASKMTSDWLSGVVKDVKAIEDENSELLGKKSLTDRFDRGLKEGDITQKQYDDAKAKGIILSKAKYDEAKYIEQKIEFIRNREIPKPEGWDKAKLSNEGKRLEWEVEHKPEAYKPPKEYTKSETEQYMWGISEKEAIERYIEKETKTYERSVKQVEELQDRFKDTSKKWDALSRAERKDPANQTLRYEYYSQKSDLKKDMEGYKWWNQKLSMLKSGEWGKINQSSLKDKYVTEVKNAIKKGKPVPYDVIKQYPEFTKSQNARERYEKGKHTSFANVSIAVDDTRKETHGIKIKLQSGKAMTDKKADEIVKTLSQFQGAVGDITQIMKKEDLTVSHTAGKHPFLSNAAGMYRPWDKTVTMGYPGVAAHEYGHFIDETAKKHKDAPKYDFELLARAKSSFNGGVERAISLSKRKSKDELVDARNLRVHLGTYWKRPEEIFARMVEQYTAYKNQDVPIKDHELTHRSFKKYTETPAYWDEESFDMLLPALETEIHRKIELAEEIE